MSVNNKSELESGNIAWWLVISLALHAAALFVLPYNRNSKPFKIYPLASAGLIELGPSGGPVSGGPDNSSPGEAGGGGNARFLNTQPRPKQVIEPKAVPLPPRQGKPSGVEAAQPAVADKGKASIASVAKESPRVPEAKVPQVAEGPVGAKTDPDIVTSPKGDVAIPTTQNPSAGITKQQTSKGIEDGAPKGTGSNEAQGALTGPGGSGSGPGGPGGDGDSPYGGNGEDFVIRGVPPVYPKYAESEGLEGDVRLSISVSSEGSPEKLQIVQSSGHPVLDKACERQIKETWRFLPTDLGYTVIVVLSFKDGQVTPKYDPIKPNR